MPHRLLPRCRPLAPGAAALLLAVLTAGSMLGAAGLLDDRVPRIRTREDIPRIRGDLIQFIWGSRALPLGLPAAVVTNVPSPVEGLVNLRRVDRLDIALAAGERTYAWHFVPDRSHRRVVLVQHGHSCTLNDVPGTPDDESAGIAPLIRALLADGYAVVGLHMPRMRPDDCRGRHEALFEIPLERGNGLQFFIEPVVVALNHAARYRDESGRPYTRFDMAGLSGGGWTTVVSAAVDSRITASFPIAGAIPLHLRAGGSVGDAEQFLPAFYGIAGYADLFLLGAAERGRTQVQILNRRDDCCFGEAQHVGAATALPYAEAMRLPELETRSQLARLGGGAFRLEIDDVAPKHLISTNAIVRIILGELNETRASFTALPSERVFARGGNGHLWEHHQGSWTDLGLDAAGPPAALERIPGELHLFYRDPLNRLRHAWRGRQRWLSAEIEELLVGDPVGFVGADGSMQLIAMTPSEQVIHWRFSADQPVAPSRTVVSGGAAAIGSPAVAVVAGQCHVFYREDSGAAWHASLAADGNPWQREEMQIRLLDTPQPMALPSAGGGIAVVARDTGGAVRMGKRPPGAAWQWNSIESGGPEGGIPCGLWGAIPPARLTVRSPVDRRLWTFDPVRVRWSVMDAGEAIAGPVMRIGEEVLGRGKAGELWKGEGGRRRSAGGWFD